MHDHANTLTGGPQGDREHLSTEQVLDRAEEKVGKVSDFAFTQISTRAQYSLETSDPSDTADEDHRNSRLTCTLLASRRGDGANDVGVVLGQEGRNVERSDRLQRDADESGAFASEEIEDDETRDERSDEFDHAKDGCCEEGRVGAFSADDFEELRSVDGDCGGQRKISFRLR